VPLVKG